MNRMQSLEAYGHAHVLITQTKIAFFIINKSRALEYETLLKTTAAGKFDTSVKLFK